jgi:hypothetical protein
MFRCLRGRLARDPPATHTWFGRRHHFTGRGYRHVHRRQTSDGAPNILAYEAP